MFEIEDEESKHKHCKGNSLENTPEIMYHVLPTEGRGNVDDAQDQEDDPGDGNEDELHLLMGHSMTGREKNRKHHQETEANVTQGKINIIFVLIDYPRDKDSHDEQYDGNHQDKPPTTGRLVQSKSDDDDQPEENTKDV